MAIYELTHDAIVPVSKISLASQGIKERQDLQRILKTHIDAISSDTLVLAEEYNNREDSRRSIDLLCLDKEANIIVIELKRTDDGGHMELQAIRYAAMVSKMTFADAVSAHSTFLERNGGSAADAEAAILRFLDWEEPIGMSLPKTFELSWSLRISARRSLRRSYGLMNATSIFAVYD